MKKCIVYGQSNNFKKIKLEVAVSNRNAIKLYEKFNFQHLEYKNDNLIMELEI
ncbi:hypothetical protein FACS189420_2990 [Bacteroidia bacterium]|nr:hypothetical protein FACS189420_2990 [Bacteroidia bacterium]